MKHLELLHNTYSPFPRRSSVVFLVAQHHVNSEFVRPRLITSSGLQKDVKGRLLFLVPVPD